MMIDSDKLLREVEEKARAVHTTAIKFKYPPSIDSDKLHELKEAARAVHATALKYKHDPYAPGVAQEFLDRATRVRDLSRVVFKGEGNGSSET